MKPKKIRVPGSGRTMTVYGGGKPPKRRFKIGQYFKLTGLGPGYMEGALHEIVAIYRLKDRPNEWIHILTERRDLVAMARGTEPGIVYDIFRDSMDSASFFFDLLGGSVHLTTQQLLKHGELVSSGGLLKIPPGTAIVKL